MIGFLCLLSFYANWNFVGVLWIVFFGIYHGNFKKQMLSFCVIGLLHIIPTFTYLDYGMTHEKMPHWHQMFILAAVPLLARYNGQKGNGPKWLSRFFYWFYPVHLLLIYGFLSKEKEKREPLTRAELPYVVGIVVLDIVAPILLMLGLEFTSGANASLLNNFEIVPLH